MLDAVTVAQDDAARNLVAVYFFGAEHQSAGQIGDDVAARYLPVL